MTATVDSSPEAIAAMVARADYAADDPWKRDIRDAHGFIAEMAALLAQVARDRDAALQAGEMASTSGAFYARQLGNAERQLVEARAALTHAASTFRWYAELHRAKGNDPANLAKVQRNEEEAAKCERVPPGETT